MSTTKAPEVGVVVLNWNGWGDTRECLTSLARLHGNPRVYAVDNGSVDGSLDRIRRAFPDVTLVPLPENRGFPGGMNAGIRAALEDGCDYVLCLNNDMTAEPDLLERLLEAAEEGVVPYPAIHQWAWPSRIDNLGQRIHLPTGLTSMVAHGARRPPAGVEADYTEVPFLSRAQLRRLGGWDERYFAFYEDADLGLRIRAAGWRLRCVPEARVYHKRGRTARRVPGLISYYSLRNRLLAVSAHGTRWEYATTLLHVLLATVPFIGLRCLLQRGYKHSFRHVLLGLRDGAFPGINGAPHWQTTRPEAPRPAPAGRAAGDAADVPPALPFPTRGQRTPEAVLWPANSPFVSAWKLVQ